MNGFIYAPSGLQGRLDGELQLRGAGALPWRAKGTIAARDANI